MNDDLELVRQYALGQSEQAFEELVARYIGLVYSAALRQVRDPGLAQEITQSVFVILARKAGSLGPGTILPGWLYRTTRYVASAALKMQQRRERRELEVQMQAAGLETDPVWEQLAPALDEAMAQLRDKDRDAIVLRFFHNKSLREVGAAFGMNEYAAQKRVSRALEKLRRFFARRGVASTTSAIAGAISGNAIHVPPIGLTKAISTVAVAKGAAASASTLTLVKGALKVMAWTKTKTAIIAGAVALLAAGTGVATWHAVRVIETRVGLTKIQGSWEGTLQQGPNKFRVVLKILKTNDTFCALIDSIDEGSQNAAFPVLSATSHSFHMALPARDMDYDATLNSDGTVLSGKFVQSKKSYALTFTRTAAPDTVLVLTRDQYAPRQDSDLQGQWQGTLMSAGAALKLTLRIAEPSPGTFLAIMDSPDQGEFNMPITSLTYQKPEVHLQIGSIGSDFAGKVNFADDRIIGTWRMQGRKGPFTLMRTTANASAAVDAQKDYGDGSRYQIQGHWKSQIPINGMTFHLVFNIALMPDGSYTATLDSPEQSVTGYPATSTECSFPNVKLAWKFDDAAFTGKIMNGKLSGTWTQGKAIVPLDFQKDIAE